MKRLTLTVLVAGLLAGSAYAADPPAAPDMEAMMKAMMEAGKTGEQHKLLGKYVGDWTYNIKMWMDPNGPPTELTGKMHAESLLGGRYVESTWTGEFMGAPFEGHGTDAYDNLAGQYVNTWIDNQGTSIILTTGTPSEDGKSITYVGEMMDPM